MNETLKIRNVNMNGRYSTNFSFAIFTFSRNFYFTPVRQPTQFCVVCWAICLARENLTFILMNRGYRYRWVSDRQ